MIDKQYLIALNKKILEIFAKRYPGTPNLFVVRNEIDDVLPMVESVGKSGDKKKDLIEKAAYLMAYISWAQPFGDGNKRTGWISATKFLRDNGYDLDLSTSEDQKEIRSLLYDIQDERTSLDQSVVKQIIFYISKRIHKHE
ncbi:MAG: Fic family protein [Nitrosarchaeum sp.]